MDRGGDRTPHRQQLHGRTQRRHHSLRVSGAPWAQALPRTVPTRIRLSPPPFTDHELGLALYISDPETVLRGAK